QQPCDKRVGESGDQPLRSYANAAGILVCTKSIRNRISPCAFRYSALELNGGSRRRHRETLSCSAASRGYRRNKADSLEYLEMFRVSSALLQSSVVLFFALWESPVPARRVRRLGLYSLSAYCQF